MSDETRPEDTQPFEDDLFVLTNDDATEQPAPEAQWNTEDILIIEDDLFVVTPPARRKWLVPALTAAAVLAAVGATILAWPGPQAPATVVAQAPVTPPRVAAAPVSPAPATPVVVAAAPAAPAPFVPAVVVPPSPEPEAPLPVVQKPSAPVLAVGDECAVLLANGRFFEGVYAGVVRYGVGKRFTVPDGHIVVMPDERAEIFERGTAGYARLHGDMKGYVVTKGGTRYTGALYIVDRKRVVVGTADERVEFRRSELKTVVVTQDVPEDEFGATVATAR